MITNIKLLNFQKHEQLELDLDQVTTIVGPSDAGKSAVLRALVFNATNSTSGKAFLREGASRVACKVTIDDHVIVRGVNKHQNIYSLDGTPFKAFGRGVPDPVADVWRISPASIQRQLDGPFLLSLSGRETAEYLNTVSGIDLLDRGVKHLVKEEKRLIGEADGLTQDQEELEACLEERESLSKALEALRAVDRLIDERDALERDLGPLVRLLEAEVPEVVEIPEGVEARIAEGEALSHSIRLLDQATSKLDRLEAQLTSERDEITEIETKLKEFEICPTCQRPL